MSITSIIESRWNNLSVRCQDWVRRTRPEILNQWELYEESQPYDQVEADSVDDALEIAEDNVDPSNYNFESTIYVEVYVRNEVTDESGSLTVTLHPEAPECSEVEHDWCSPYEVLGGLKDNPGVWGHGGGVIMKRVCPHCGMYMITDTWAQNPETGEQGLTSIRYDEADHASQQWVDQKDNQND